MPVRRLHRRPHRHPHRRSLAASAVVVLWCALAGADLAAQPAAAMRDPFTEPAARFSSSDLTSEQAIQWRNEARDLEDGNGVPRDLRLAAQLYCRAARLGDAEAQFSLAWLLMNGRGVPRDDSHAAHLVAAAAEQGIVQAQNLLQSIGAPRGEVPPCLRSPDADRVVRAAPEPARSAAPVALVPPSSVRLPPPANAPEAIVKFVDLVAPEYKLEPQLVLAVMATESNFNALAVSPKNAHGLMQLIPATAARFNVRNLKDPVDNMRGGMAYLRWLMAYFEGDVMLALAAYNAGEGAVERYKGVPPYAETRQYVLRILAAIGGKLSHPFDPNVTPPSAVVAKGRAHSSPR